MTRRSVLEFMLRRPTVAVIGATSLKGSVARTVLENLKKANLGGKIYAVNPNHAEVLGEPCYPSIAAVPAKVELAVVIICAVDVPSVIDECVRTGAGAVVVISEEFKEHGAEGAALEENIREHLRVCNPLIDQLSIQEIDVNSLLASPGGIVPVDARIIEFQAGNQTDTVSALAIRPYPLKYVDGWLTRSGSPVLIRPIRPEDEPLLAKFHEGLSEATVYLRYFHMMSLDARVAHARLMRQCFIDYNQEMALVAEHTNPTSGESEIWAVARLTKSRNKPQAEVSVLVTDQHQKEGLGGELLSRLIGVARDEKLERIVAYILPENSEMMSLGRRFGFRPLPTSDPDLLAVVLDL